MTTVAAFPSRSPLRACFDLARAGNFPSVASNVLAALVLSDLTRSVWPSLYLLSLSILAGFLTYAGGATFNDVADAKFDAANRPERAIPRGIITRAAASGIGAIEMLLGLGLLIAAGAWWVWAAALAATILAYDWVHKRWSGSVILMAGCRVLLAVTVASLPRHTAGTAFKWWIGILFAYMVTLSVIARLEYTRRRTADSLAKEALGRSRSPQPIQAPVRRDFSVGRLLAFIPLIDAIALLVAGAWIPALACAAAVPLGRWAQRLAAST